MSPLSETIEQNCRAHTATVFFFHGSGDSGNYLLEWIRYLLGKDMQIDHVKIVYPTAPLQPFTPLGGEQSNVWFDRIALKPNVKEIRPSLESIYEHIAQLIDDEVRQGIPLHRIIVGGFSMGGALALHTAYHLRPTIRACFSVSSFLNDTSIVYETLCGHQTAAPTIDREGKKPDLLMFHGDQDTLVPMEWGRQTFERLRSSGVAGEFVVTKNATHKLRKPQIERLQEWIGALLPPTTTTTTTQESKILSLVDIVKYVQ